MEDSTTELSPGSGGSTVGYTSIEPSVAPGGVSRQRCRAIGLTSALAMAFGCVIRVLTRSGFNGIWLLPFVPLAAIGLVFGCVSYVRGGRPLLGVLLNGAALGLFCAYVCGGSDMFWIGP